MLNKTTFLNIFSLYIIQINLSLIKKCHPQIPYLNSKATESDSKSPQTKSNQNHKHSSKSLSKTKPMESLKSGIMSYATENFIPSSLCSPSPPKKISESYNKSLQSSSGIKIKSFAKSSPKKSPKFLHLSSET